MIFLALVLTGIVVLAGGTGFTVTVVQPTGGNASWLGVRHSLFNITLNDSAVNVTYQVWNGSTTYNISATNVSTYLVWTGNMTTLTDGNVLETLLDEIHTNYKMNVTIFIDVGGVNETIKTGYTFFIDTINPDVNNYTQPTISNGTGGDQIIVSTEIIDNSTDSCWYNLFFRPLALSTFSNDTLVRTVIANLSPATGRYKSCNYTFAADNFSNNGYYTFQAVANDSAGNSADVDANTTVIMHILKGSKWNLISALAVDNGTAAKGRGGNFYQWVFNHSNIDYISTWNASYMNNPTSITQGFVTYQRAVAANNETSVDIGDALYVYPSADSLLIRLNITESTSYENVTFYNESKPWYLVGNPFADVNLSVLSTVINSTSWTSYHNLTNGYYYTYARGFGPTVNDVFVGKGLAYWMDTNVSQYTTNVTWSRSLNTGWYKVGG